MDNDIRGNLTVTSVAIKDVDGLVIVEPIIIMEELGVTKQQAEGLSAAVREMNTCPLVCMWVVERAL